MKILFSPSESKNENCTDKPFDKDSFIFKELFDYRMQALNSFFDYIKNTSIEDLKEFFGIKDEKEIKKFIQNLHNQPTKKAVELYNGVSYEYLDFNTLNKKAKDYIYKNTLIFSNLFGVVRADNLLPFYKFKQGAKLPSLSLEKFYKQHFSKALDEFLQDEVIIDLRAGYYDKFYTPNKQFTTYKFIKNGKIISHFAKAYRGMLLRILAQNDIQDNNTLLSKLPLNLKLKEIKYINLKEEILLEIID